MEEGQFILNGEIINEIPKFYVVNNNDEQGYVSGIFDRNGNRVTNVPWVDFEGYLFATRFRLWDFDNDGIPEISVYYDGNYEDNTVNIGVPARMYKFIDGAYRNTTPDNLEYVTRTRHTSWSSMYTDNEGRLIQSDIGLGGAHMIWFDYVDFIGHNAKFSRIATFEFSRGIWAVGDAEMRTEGVPFTWDWEPTWWDRGYGSSDFHEVLFHSLGIELTPVEQLTDLHTEITAAVTVRLIEEEYSEPSDRKLFRHRGKHRQQQERFSLKQFK